MKTNLKAYFFHAESESIFVDNLVQGPEKAANQGFDLVKIGMAFDPSMEEIERRFKKRLNHLGIRYIAEIFERELRWYNTKTGVFEEMPF